MARRDLTGHVLCDMHDYQGEPIDVDGQKWFIVPESWQTVHTDKGSEFIEDCIEGPYTNKYLVVIEDRYEDKLIAAYSYDALRFGIMTLRPVE